MRKKLKTEILKEDQEEFNQKIGFLKKDSKLNIFCSFTYITPNYDVLATIKELHNFLKDTNFKVFLVMWDMNSLANPYFKKYLSNRVHDQDAFIEDKINEVRRITNVMGFNKDNLVIYKSSDLWRRLVSYKEENLFQQFFSILARLPVKQFSNFRKCSHIFQISLDLFFANYFKKLYPEDTDEDLDIIFSDYYKKKIYLTTRELMIKEGVIKDKPLFLIMETVPYIVYNERVPEWNMKLEEIKYILMNAENRKSEFIKVLNYLNGETINENFENKEDIVEILSNELFEYLSKYKKLCSEQNGYLGDSIVNIHKEKDAIELGQTLKSRISLNILRFADGTLSTSQMAKKLDKSIATISSYTTKLKNLKLIRVEDGMIKRNIKGFKINFELGL